MSSPRGKSSTYWLPLLLEVALSPLPRRGFAEAVKLTPNMSSMDPA
eukprot:CAMPEP_0184996680 /NCGR_PEP_ID=MMETSP1098-20130426/57233_1 /TAXON_ID=89044 /ORGANISM="Spumella elongata, Strain CCAP 955/1" /LENGTH=45 /DNA_ID= /DNA_START= /DNA_END= /DNA_ORIENTATION=